jgi:hypothetical protein
MPTYRCEVLILGGGILGMWVLDRLVQAGFQSPVLLESELLGCRQTGHSDAFLHQGYAYYAASGARVLIDAWTAWQPWLPLPTPPITPVPAHHVYLDPLKHQAAVTWRQSPGFPLAPPQHHFNGTHPAVAVAHDAIETDEQCVMGDWVVGRLQDAKQPRVRKVQRVDQITLDLDPRLGALRIKSVAVVMNDGSAGLFEPNTLLVCAGERNKDLLDPQKLILPSGASLPPAFSRPNQLQREVDMDMLVVRDRNGLLPVFNGSLSGGSVQDQQGLSWKARAFVVSRRDLNQDLIWIVSGQVYRTDSAGQRQSLMTGKALRRMLIDYLSLLFPAFGQSYQQMVWGVYPARLTTWQRPAGMGLDDLTRRTFTDMGVEGLLVCYTDRLTITPLAAEEIEQEISSNLRLRWPTAAVAMPTLPPQPVTVHPEYWRTPGRWEQETSWTWPDFQANCL